ncbi:hypothetical protein JXA05_02950 [Candidatus Peregrinibacteria bacterium]|nr:hypothetical protein [Candidatus Peregrinibacteria bacterium]
MASENPNENMTEAAAPQPEDQKEMLAFRKGKQEEVQEVKQAENPAEAVAATRVRVFKPSKEKYDDPKELVEEYRKFIKEDLQDGEEMKISKEDAQKVAEAHAKAAAAEQKEKDAGSAEPFLATPPMDRKELENLLLKESMNLLFVLGVHT